MKKKVKAMKIVKAKVERVRTEDKKENVLMIQVLIVAGFAIALSLFAWWQISPATFNEYTTICEANGGGNCMAFYWRQLSYYQWVIKGSIATTIISLGVAVWAGVGRKR